jgi:hypothetical protein
MITKASTVQIGRMISRPIAIPLDAFASFLFDNWLGWPNCRSFPARSCELSVFIWRQPSTGYTPPRSNYPDMVSAITSRPVSFTIRPVSSRTDYWIGLLLGTVNVVRHRVVGYRRPRQFGADQIARSVDYVFEVVDRWQTRGDVDWTGKRVLELGPGPDLGTGAIILDRGAVSYQAIDAFDLVSTAPDEFYDALAARLSGHFVKSRLSFAKPPSLACRRSTAGSMSSSAMRRWSTLTVSPRCFVACDC